MVLPFKNLPKLLMILDNHVIVSHAPLLLETENAVKQTVWTTGNMATKHVVSHVQTNANARNPT
jgi:hypothetical protein